jgi:hypothetical protein
MGSGTATQCHVWKGCHRARKGADREQSEKGLIEFPHGAARIAVFPICETVTHGSGLDRRQRMDYTCALASHLSERLRALPILAQGRGSAASPGSSGRPGQQAVARAYGGMDVLVDGNLRSGGHAKWMN